MSSNGTSGQLHRPAATSRALTPANWDKRNKMIDLLVPNFRNQNLSR